MVDRSEEGGLILILQKTAAIFRQKRLTGYVSAGG